MKVLAIITLASSAEISGVRDHLHDELRKSWGLYSRNVIREMYLTEDPTRVVFILEAEGTASAAAELKELPLVNSGAFTLQLIELHPFVNWAKLFAEPA